MKNKNNDVVPGSAVRENHRKTVLSICGADRMVPVQSSGTGFYMRGKFGWRIAAQRLVTDRDPARLAQHVASQPEIAPMINIAQCDDQISRRVYLAMVGGAAHEALHRVYSQQGNLTEHAIRAATEPLRANPTVDWTRHSKMILDLQNIFEDVAIERIGCAEYPGIFVKMCDLADFIVKMERDSRSEAGQPVNAVSAVFIALRDIGLGYNTEYIRANLADIRRECPEGFAMVANGPLHGILLRSIPDVSTSDARERAKQDLVNGSALTLALEAVAILSKLSKGDPSGGGGSKGEGQSAKGEGQPSGGESSKGEGQPSKGDGPEGEGQPSGGEEKSSKGDGPEGEGQSAKGGEKPSPNGQGKGSGSRSPAREGRNEKGTDTGNANGAGGGEGDSKVTARDILDQHAKTGKGTLDSNSALEAGIREEIAKDPARTDIAPWRPYSTSEDVVVRVKARSSNAGTFAIATGDVRVSTTYLRTRLGIIFRALEESGVEHGVRKGPALSGRMLVNSYCEMAGGSMPSRAYMDRTPAVDMSIAAALVIDESSSMRSKLFETTQVAYALMDALDGIGAKSMAVGFRSKHSTFQNNYSTHLGSEGCHRTHAMEYDLFKSWEETFKTAAPRLGEIRAQGGTPMADGIEFALRELSTRPEGHRIMFVLTDGEPDFGHSPVMRSQLQRAAEAGILIVGVGLGYGSEYVQHTFPDSVYAANIAALPKLLVAKLESLVRTRHALAKRGRAVRAA